MNPDLKLIEAILTKLILLGSNLDVVTNDESIVVTGNIEGKTIKIMFYLFTPNIREIMSNNLYISIDVSITVENRLALSHVSIHKDFYSRFTVLIKAVEKQRDRLFDRQAAYNFIADIAGKA